MQAKTEKRVEGEIIEHGFVSLLALNIYCLVNGPSFQLDNQYKDIFQWVSI